MKKFILVGAFLMSSIGASASGLPEIANMSAVLVPYLTGNGDGKTYELIGPIRDKLVTPLKAEGPVIFKPIFQKMVTSDCGAFLLDLKVYNATTLDGKKDTYAAMVPLEICKNMLPRQTILAPHQVQEALEDVEETEDFIKPLSKPRK